MKTATATIPQTHASPQHLRDRRILIVDDVELNVTMIEKVLRHHGFENIATAGNGKEALEVAASSPPDMIILDIQMPVMDGFECSKRFRALKRHRDTPILIQTVLTQPEMRYKAFTHGATDIISKPVEPDELYARTLVHLEKQFYLQELKNYYERTSNELEQARALQLAILPPLHELEHIRARTNLDIAAHFCPSSELGGDFWGVKKLHPQQTAFWLVDFSGHGVGAAINVFRLHAYLQELTPLAARPGAYLAMLNEKLLDLMEPGQFATMFYGIIDQQGQQLLYASAGSPHPILHRARSGKAEIIDATGLPLGLSLHEYPTQKIAFNPGDRLLFYSDALTETGDAHGAFSSEQELMQLMQSNAEKPARQLVAAILKSCIDGRREQVRDDLTICACCWQTP